MIVMLAKIKTSSRSGSINKMRLSCDIQTTDSTVRSHSEVSSNYLHKTFHTVAGRLIVSEVDLVLNVDFYSNKKFLLFARALLVGNEGLYSTILK